MACQQKKKKTVFSNDFMQQTFCDVTKLLETETQLYYEIIFDYINDLGIPAHGPAKILRNRGYFVKDKNVILNSPSISSNS